MCFRSLLSLVRRKPKIVGIKLEEGLWNAVVCPECFGIDGFGGCKTCNGYGVIRQHNGTGEVQKLYEGKDGNLYWK